MNSNPTEQALLAFLRCDRMRNIVPLKMLAAHGIAIQSYFQRQGNEAGALLFFPTSLFAYDRQTYGERDLAVLLVAGTPAVGETLLAQLPRSQKLVFKLMSEELRNVVAQHFTLSRARAFISYTTDNQITLTNYAQVRMTQQVDERLYVEHWLNTA